MICMAYIHYTHYIHNIHYIQHYTHYTHYTHYIHYTHYAHYIHYIHYIHSPPYPHCPHYTHYTDCISNPLPFEAPFSDGEYLPDYVINSHPRFAALVRNIKARRGSKVDIRVPLYRDIHTPEYQTAEGSTEDAGGPHIHMDAMAFGMGMCCLQVTFQARDVDESRSVTHAHSC